MNQIDSETASSIYHAIGDAPVTRAQIAAALGLKPTTVKTALTRLMFAGLVTFGEPLRTGRKGRPAQTYLRKPLEEVKAQRAAAAEETAP